ncbi:MAG TPA: hypothetical protein VLN49_18930 [Gemmatimonadaceae bacterium]|nr:hypothetical protein [Gemmatimonadaceae bacterium]
MSDAAARTTKHEFQPGRYMKTNGIASAATGLLLLLSITAARSAAPSQGIEACTVLTVGEVSKALEQSSKPGKRMVESSPDGCIWSADPVASDTSRQVALNMHTPRAFMAAKSPAITTIKIEPVSGVGDEAFYQIYPAPRDPFIWVRKGKNAISIKVMGTTANQFSVEQDKSKLLTLAKSAVGRL